MSASGEFIDRGTKLDFMDCHLKGNLHAFLAKVIHLNYLTKITQTTTGAEISIATRGKGRLRWLTVPDESWSGEMVIMSHLPGGVSKRVEEVIGIDHSMDKVRLRGFRQTAKRLTTKHEPTAFNTCRSAGQQLFPSGKASSNKLFSPDRGFDMVWLNFSSPPTDSVLGDLSIMAENVGIFERAWKCGRPGLLFITMQMGANLRTVLNTLDWIHHNMGLPDDYLSESYCLRANGITRFLNQTTIPLGFSCLPAYWMFYRENLSSEPASLRCFIGFEVWKGRHNIEPEFTRILKRPV